MSRRSSVVLRSSSAKLAVAILAVDNVRVSNFGMNLLKRKEEGSITYEQAREALRMRAIALAGGSTI